jgi:hypothetical protein
VEKASEMTSLCNRTLNPGDAAIDGERGWALNAARLVWIPWDFESSETTMNRPT